MQLFKISFNHLVVVNSLGNLDLQLLLSLCTISDSRRECSHMPQKQLTVKCFTVCSFDPFIYFISTAEYTKKLKKRKLVESYSSMHFIVSKNFFPTRYQMQLWASQTGQCKSNFDLHLFCL